MFSVAHFMVSDDISVIASDWVQDGKTFWPPFKSSTRVTAAIKGRMKPDYDWEQFTCRVLSSTDSYEVARKRAIRAEERSDVTSEPEANVKRTRRPPRPLDDYLTESSSDEDPTTEEPTPSDHMEFLDEPPQAPLPRNSGSQSIGAREKDCDGNVVCKTGRAETTSSSNCTPQPCKNVLLTVLRELEHIKVQLTSQALTLSRIERKVNGDAPAAMTEPVRPQDMPVYPVGTDEELALLEASLKNEAIFAMLVRNLGQMGGGNVALATKAVFKKLVNDEVAILYNWTGRKGKKKARKLNITPLIFAAVRVNFSRATDDEMGHAIGEWLRFANVRLTNAKAKKS
ncbi:uncharacterized protein LOC121833279 [Ixodes scapularis]|uniref:uncharacterized protein LOC121833279 n=1 Tax=Ixodes scapularis TaxID=6945 RepID=UPI001C385214|nr:uncharacterized protein LOC121833279 [Ixodes scapularis]